MQTSALTSLLVIVPVVLFALTTMALVWLTDHKSVANRVFLVLVGVAASWGVLSTLSFDAGSARFAYFTSDLASALSYLLLVVALMFSEYYFRAKLSGWIKYILLPLSAPLLVLFGSNLTCGRLNAANNCTGSPSYNFMLLLIVALFALILRNCFIGTQSPEKSEASRARLILYGFLASIGAGIILAFVLPVLGISYFNKLYPATPMIFIGYILYAVVKHQLFDVRVFVVRSLAYIISLSVMVAIYGFVIFGFMARLLDVRIELKSQLILSVVTAIATLAFPKMKLYFDRTTNRLFYRDAYDPEWLFHHLNKVLVSSLDMKYLMTQSISVIESALKTDFVVVGIKQSEGAPRIFTSKKVIIAEADIAKMRHLTTHVHQKVIIASTLDEDKYADLRQIMRKYDMAVIVRLAQNVRRAEEGLGYLVLGPKKSGNPYTRQDQSVLDTVANELIIAIQNASHYEEIQQFNVQLQTRIDDATRKLRRTNEKLKALDETKDDFISMASHQLRTPLTSVKGYLSMVLEGDAGEINETQKKMLGQAFISSQRMVYLIADLLNVSRLKTGKFIIEPAPTNLATMVSEEIDQLVETAAARDIKLTYDKPKEFPDLMLDETKTRQVIMNFVDNAIYYTPSGGHIRVELHDTPTSVELRVVDDGIGVPKAEQHHLFTKFYRARNAQKARPDGTGLGLFMAKKVILAQGGSIIFESKEGKGSTFGFLFPKKANSKFQPLPVKEPAAASTQNA